MKEANLNFNQVNEIKIDKEKTLYTTTKKSYHLLHAIETIIGAIYR